jgi:hypothetical protein
VTVVPMPKTASSPHPAAMKIGDLVLYEGRAFVLCGLEPMSVPNRGAELEDPDTGERIVVPLDEVSPRDP